MMAVKNRTVDYMTMEHRENVIKLAIMQERRQRQKKRFKQSVLRAEMMKRIAAKTEQKAAKERKQLERELTTGHVQDITDRFSLNDRRQEDLTDILEGLSGGVTLAIRGWTPRLVYASFTMAGLRGVTFALRGWTPR